MSVFEAIVLGVTQGLTEFLPISSSGHLILVPWLFGWEPSSLAFDAALHLGTLVAVFIYFRYDIVSMILASPMAVRHPLAMLNAPAPDDAHAIDAASQRQAFGKLGLLIVLGSIPAGVVGLLAEERIDTFFHSGEDIDRAIVVIGVLLIVFALMLLWAELRGSKSRSLQRLTWRDSVAIGLAQCFALLPGVSRSGVTLSAGLFRGITRADAARFSFLLGIPLIAIAGMSGVVDIARASPDRDEVITLIVGMVSAAISGLAAIWALLRFLQHSSTVVFVIYRILVGAGVILLVASGFR